MRTWSPDRKPSILITSARLTATTTRRPTTPPTIVMTASLPVRPDQSRRQLSPGHPLGISRSRRSGAPGFGRRVTRVAETHPPSFSAKARVRLGDGTELGEAVVAFSRPGIDLDNVEYSGTVAFEQTLPVEVLRKIGGARASGSIGTSEWASQQSRLPSCKRPIGSSWSFSSRTASRSRRSGVVPDPAIWDGASSVGPDSPDGALSRIGTSDSVGGRLVR